MAIPTRQVSDDPRLQLGAYVTNQKDLFEVIGRSRAMVDLENCKSGEKVKRHAATVLAWELVKSSPSCPDTLVEDSADH